MARRRRANIARGERMNRQARTDRWDVATREPSDAVYLAYRRGRIPLVLASARWQFLIYVRTVAGKRIGHDPAIHNAIRRRSLLT
jgi:hypothetical protein